MKLNQFFKGKKVLVTGHTGFKGAWLTQWLVNLNAKVYGLSNALVTTPSLFEDLKLESKIDHQLMDIRNSEAVLDRVKKIQPDIVFHLAAQAIVSRSYSDPLETFSTNVMGTANILEALRVAQRPAIAVIITSDKCYDNVEWEWGYRENDHLGGKDIYSGSKGAAELVAKSYYHSFFKNGPVRLCTTRAGNVLGGGDWAQDRIVPDCYRAWMENRPVVIRNPLATRPWQHVLVPLSGYLKLAMDLPSDEKLSGQAFNFGPASETCASVQKLLEDLHTASPLYKGGAPFDIQGSNFHEANLLKLNCDKALMRLKWKPAMSYEESIRLISDWYCSYAKGLKGQELVDLTLKQISTFEDWYSNRVVKL